VSNNNTPALTRSLHEAAATASSEQLPLGSLHPITLKSYYKVSPARAQQHSAWPGPR
jgi:hypothetical protein